MLKKPYTTSHLCSAWQDSVLGIPCRGIVKYQCHLWDDDESGHTDVNNISTYSLSVISWLSSTVKASKKTIIFAFVQKWLNTPPPPPRVIRMRVKAGQLSRHTNVHLKGQLLLGSHDTDFKMTYFTWDLLTLAWQWSIVIFKSMRYFECRLRYKILVSNLPPKKFCLMIVGIYVDI